MFKSGLLFALLSVSTFSFANNSSASIGLGLGYAPSTYIDTDPTVAPLPQIFLSHGHVYVQGFTAGLSLYPRGSEENLSVQLRYDPRSYDPEDSDNANMQLLDEREAALFGGVVYERLSVIGIVKAELSMDISGTHSGLIGQVSWSLPIIRKGFRITPTLGYLYQSEDVNNHLYGVSGAESDRTSGSIPAFDLDWEGQFFAALSVGIPISDVLTMTVGAQYVNLQGEVANSPIIERSSSVGGSVGMSYRF
ncbi:MipA/OmpV family protein [Vibrio sp.]|nr:MipA/OmpV family protein [Vibrio sp.]